MWLAAIPPCDRWRKSFNEFQYKNKAVRYLWALFIIEIGSPIYFYQIVIMGKGQKLNVKPEKNVPLDRQILDSKVAKQKHRNKVKFRAQESGVSAHFWCSSSRMCPLTAY